MKKEIGYKTLSVLVITFLLLLIGFPIFMMISLSLQTMNEIYSGKFVLIPETLKFENYVKAMSHGNWGRYIFNSLFVTSIVVIISLIINSMTGYAFARIVFKGKNILFLFLLIGMMIPPQVTLLPVFLIMRGFPLAGGNDIFGQSGQGLINTYSGLILPFIAGSFGVFLCRQFFSTFPKELDDAAKMDGCGRIKAFFHIYLPLSVPVLASLGILKFTGTWNEYTWPLIATPFSDEMRTVQIALTSFRNEGEIFWNQLMAATLITSLIVYIPFIFLQKYFVSGIMSGSVKE